MIVENKNECYFSIVKGTSNLR